MSLKGRNIIDALGPAGALVLTTDAFAPSNLGDGHGGPTGRSFVRLIQPAQKLRA